MFREPAADPYLAAASGGVSPGSSSTVDPVEPVAVRNLLDLQTSPGWHADALCAQSDPEAFFPEKGMSALAAKRICGSCPVAAQCLAWAIEHRERHGVWGGMTERERDRLRKSGRPITVPRPPPDPIPVVELRPGTGPSEPRIDPVAPARGRRRDLSERMEVLYQAGLNDRDIAAECGCSASNVSGWRRRRSLKPNRDGAVA